MEGRRRMGTLPPSTGIPFRTKEKLLHMLTGFHRTISMCALVLALCSPAWAGSVNYGDFLGGGPGDVDFLQVIESSITDAVPLYNTPTHVGNGLFFFPDSFASASSGGGADNTSATLSMRIRAHPGFFLEVVRIEEAGGYQLTGIGGSGTSATINGLLTVTDIAPGTHGVLTNALSVSPPPIYSSPNSTLGDFTALTQINLTGMGISQVVLNFNNNLQTASEPGTSARIEKDEIRIYSPEPTTLAFLLIAVPALRRRPLCVGA
jgi:hypothetical protein